LSITSCLARNDFNIIFSLFILIILNNFYNENPKMFTKIIIHLLTMLILADLIWIFVMSSSWSHTKDSTSNLYWSGLSGMHTFVTILAYLELILKGLIAVYLFSDFKAKYPMEISKICLKYLYR
jgi:hypothetical protein